jgi:hypothetical protein
MKTTKPPQHRTDKPAKRTNGQAPEEIAMLDTNKSNDRMRYIRITMRATEMYGLVCAMLDADTPEKIAALRKRAIGVRFEIESGQRNSDAHTKQDRSPM